jgi:hypothetical protein
MQMAAVLRRRNEILPVARLPADLLLRIFLDLTVDYHTNEVSIPQRLNFTHVCMTWRRTALELSPMLWTYLETRSEAAAIKFIRRSRTAPLIARMRKATSPRVWSLVLSQLRRIRELDIRVYDNDELLQHIKSSSGPASMLQKFSLHLSEGWFPDTLPVPDYKRGISPCMRELTLELCAIVWAPPQLQGLRYLHLNDPLYKNQNSWDDLFNLLNCSPNLEELRLVYATPRLPRVEYTCEVH